MTDRSEDDETAPPSKSEAAPGLYSPDPVEATRMREKGLGMGEEDLRLQRDPAGATTTEAFREATGTSAEDEATDEQSAANRPSDRRH